MGREVRMVPPDWKHPKKGGRYIPLHQGWSRMLEERRQWSLGFKRDYKTDAFVPHDKDDDYTVDEYFGEMPSRDEYMPEWPPEVATHYMMYEDTTEGTPISPAFATPEELARWLADTNASAFGGMGASYEGWLSTIKRGHAVGMVMTLGPEGSSMQSGVEAFRSSDVQSGGRDDDAR